MIGVEKIFFDFLWCFVTVCGFFSGGEINPKILKHLKFSSDVPPQTGFQSAKLDNNLSTEL